VAWIEVKKIDDDNKTYMFNENDIDFTKYRRLTEEEIAASKKKSKEFDELLKSGAKFSLGISMGKSGTSHSPYYKGKLDSGAAEELIDRGLEQAKDRGTERKEKTGNSFGRGRHGVIVPSK